MATLKEEAKAYKPQQTKNIAELPRVPTDLEVHYGQFETTDNEGKSKVVEYKYVIVDGEEYRVPNSVLRDLRIIAEDNENVTSFKVVKKGEGLNTSYTVIPLTA